MASKSKNQQSPVKKKFSSPLGNQKYVTKGISPRLKASLKDFRPSGFAKQCKQRDLGPNHGKQWKKPNEKNRKNPIRFHYGGNSADPLNLNSLIGRDPSLATPQASPLSVHSESPAPVEVFEPRDKTDPLNLKCSALGLAKEDSQVTPKKRKKRKRHQSVGHHDSENDVGSKEQSGSVSHKEADSTSKGKRKKKKHALKASHTSEEQSTTSCAELSDTVVLETEEVQQCKSVIGECEPSPKKKKLSVSSETAVEERKEDNSVCELENISSSIEISSTNHAEVSDSRKQYGSNKLKDSFKKETHQSRKTSQKEKLFIYGNYNRYYGYRNPHCSQDIRLKSFKKEWFTGKDVLDIGCNVGHLTLSIAKDFAPQLVLGIDIDGSLIKAARNNLRYYVQTCDSIPMASRHGMKFPVSFSLTCGPLAAPVVLDNKNKSDAIFPQNVFFKQENYVPTSSDSLAKQQPMYDLILCLSLTKWVHLNWGDEGLKLMFRKIFLNLRPGGRLILEPQPFSSYKKKRNLTEKIRANYDAIRFRPEHFIDYLLSDMVGFVTFEVLEVPQHKAAGFQRPLYLLSKACDDDAWC